MGLSGSEKVPDYRNIGAEASERGARGDISQNSTVPIDCAIEIGFIYRHGQEGHPRG
jgi:hypothetical protein